MYGYVSLELGLNVCTTEKVAVSVSNFHLNSGAALYQQVFCFQDGHIDFREFMIVLYIMSNGSPGEDITKMPVFNPKLPQRKT